MSQKRNVILCFMNFYETDISNSIYNQLLESRYLDDNGYGFKNTSFDENSITTTLIKRCATYIMDFDPIANEFEKKKIFIFNEINFSIDFNYKILSVFGTATYMNQVKSSLLNTLDFKFSTDSITISPYNVYHALKKDKSNITLSEIGISNFIYKNGASGKFSAKIFDQKIGEELLEEYKPEIAKVSITLNIEDSERCIYNIRNNGIVNIMSEEDDFEKNFSYLKRTISNFYA